VAQIDALPKIFALNEIDSRCRRKKKVLRTREKHAAIVAA
jgi:hypothetical protein